MRISVLHTPADEEDDDDDEDDEVALGGVLSGVVVQPAHMACVWVRFPWEGIEIEPLAICIKVSPPHFFLPSHTSLPQLDIAFVVRNECVSSVCIGMCKRYRVRTWILWHTSEGGKNVI